MSMKLPMADELPRHHIRVDFGAGIPGEVQGPALLALEKLIRGQGIPVEVFKREAPDDLKRRRDMTSEDRRRL